MRTGLFLFFFIMTGFCASAFAGQGEELFAQAVQKYQSGDYAAAIDLNERILKEAGVESASVYFNLGNSYFRNGELGRAIANYLRAQRLTPRDADIKANLFFARQAVQQYESEGAVVDKDRWIRLFRVLSLGEFKWLALGALMLTGIVFVWGLYGCLPFKRVLLWTGLSLVVTGYILTAFGACFLDAAGRAVILARTEAFFEPSVQATVYFKLPEGAEVKIIRRKEGWLKIRRADGRSGWVLDKSAEEL